LCQCKEKLVTEDDFWNVFKLKKKRKKEQIIHAFACGNEHNFEREIFTLQITACARQKEIQSKITLTLFILPLIELFKIPKCAKGQFLELFLL
jgi:hypothetical protein